MLSAYVVTLRDNGSVVRVAMVYARNMKGACCAMLDGTVDVTATATLMLGKAARAI